MAKPSVPASLWVLFSAEGMVMGAHPATYPNPPWTPWLGQSVHQYRLCKPPAKRKARRK